MTARNAAIRTAPGEPCPFCGCGLALNAHAPVRRARKLRATVTMGRHPDGTVVSRVGPVSIFAPGTAHDLAVAAAAYAATVAGWDAHRLAGEVPVITDGRAEVAWRKLPGQVAA